MADRNLVTYTESRTAEGPYWRLKVDRSASGKPGLFFTIQTETFSEDDRHIDLLNQDLTIVVEDAWEILDPILEWLGGEGK